MSNIEFDFFKAHIKGLYRDRDFPIQYKSFKRSNEATYNQHEAKFKNDVSYQKTDFSSFNKSHEAMFKIASYTYSSKQTYNAISYIAEHSKGLEKPNNILDESYNSINKNEFKDKIEDFNLEQKRKNERLMVHFIVSFPKDCNLTKEQLNKFATEYMKPFGEDGFKYVYTAHTHQARSHIHVLLRLSNGHKKLNFRKKEIQNMRIHQVETAKKFGIELTASRCYERKIDKIPVKKTLLERQVPNWYSRYKNPLNSPSPIDYSWIKSDQLNKWSLSFNDPIMAKQKFLEMYIEHPKTAFYYANNRPNIFENDMNSTNLPKITSSNFSINQEQINRIKWAIYETKNLNVCKI
ncbi:MAG: relaxase/mobilization nuclease domain-containing protein [Alphaproteobacteria bacterium]|nr:relaxase/mobilization nuclease domain-containing protein [Alphaproteobacteria bacterium]